MTKICPLCKENKPFIEFRKNKNSKNGLSAYCKPCGRKKDKQASERYQLRNNSEEFISTESEKFCNDCKQIKGINFFFKDSARAKGHSAYCKSCSVARNWLRYMKNKYNLTKQDFENLLLSQDNKCDICKKDISNNYNVDHNHKTGKVRALLCMNCNTLIGHAKENTDILNSAIEYLKKHSY